MTAWWLRHAVVTEVSQTRPASPLHGFTLISPQNPMLSTWQEQQEGKLKLSSMTSPCNRAVPAKGRGAVLLTSMVSTTSLWSRYCWRHWVTCPGQAPPHSTEPAQFPTLTTCRATTVVQLHAVRGGNLPVLRLLLQVVHHEPPLLPGVAGRPGPHETLPGCVSSQVNNGAGCDQLISFYQIF